MCVCVDSSVLEARGNSAPRGKGVRRLQHANGSTANLENQQYPPKHPACSAQEPNGGLRVSTCNAVLFLVTFHSRSWRSPCQALLPKLREKQMLPDAACSRECVDRYLPQQRPL